jgi:hypothetical protein
VAEFGKLLPPAFPTYIHTKNNFSHSGFKPDRALLLSIKICKRVVNKKS